MNRKQIFWWVVIILLISLVVYRAANKISVSRKITEERIVPVKVSLPAYGRIEEKLSFTGEIKAETEVKVMPKTVGRVAEIYVKEGDLVNKGDKLLSFVPGISPESELYEDVVTFAPIFGIVGNQLVKLGEQVGPQTSLFTLYEIDRVKVLIDVPERYYSLISPGLRAEIKLDAYPDQEFIGKVTQIRPVVDPLSRTTQVEILVPNYSHRIKPGMFCRVNLVLKEKASALLVPKDAILGNAEKYVFVVEGGRAVKKFIKIGLEEAEKSEVVSGLTSSDQIIVVGQQMVAEGTRVEVK